VRVASRRIREALPVVGAEAPSSQVKKLARKVRRLTRDLGRIRELDVELRILEERSNADGEEGRAIEMLRREVVAERQTQQRGLADSVPAGDLKKLIKKLERVGGLQRAEGTERAEGRGQRDEGRWRGVLASRLIKRAKELRTALNEAGPVYAPERLHRVRLAVKKLRYALEIAGDVGLTSARPLVRVLKREQQRLGRLNDLQAVLKRVRGTRAASTGPQGAELTALAEALERECCRLHAGFVEQRHELVECTRDVRQHLVTTLVGPSRRPARAVVVPGHLPRARVWAR
jgi:CHAD domain-containing protein